MGQIIYFINHTKKEFFRPFGSKWREITLNPRIMEKILEFIRSDWNGDRIEIINSFQFCKREDTFAYYTDTTEEKGFKYKKKEVEQE